MLVVRKPNGLAFVILFPRTVNASWIWYFGPGCVVWRRTKLKSIL